MNPFRVNDTVDTGPQATTQRRGGRVKYIACLASRGSNATCAKATCTHATKDVVFVTWSGGAGTFSYLYGELVHSAAAQSYSPTGNPQPGHPTGHPSAPKLSPTDSEPSRADTQRAAEKVAEKVVQEFKTSMGKFRANPEPMTIDQIDWSRYNGTGGPEHVRAGMKGQYRKGS